MKGKQRNIAILILMILIITIIGCSVHAENLAEESFKENYSEDSVFDKGLQLSAWAAYWNLDIDDEITTIKAEEGSTQVGSTIQWPKDKMGNLKELKANITMVSEDRENVITYIMFEGLEKAGAEKYLESIKELGYKPIYEV